MRIIKSLNDLNLPNKYLNFLRVYLDNLSKIYSIDLVILFGSCARGSIHEHSDIDLMVIGNDISSEDETSIYFECVPDVSFSDYINTDVIVCDHERYDKYKTQVGYVQRHVENYGIDLTSYFNNLRGVII